MHRSKPLRPCERAVPRAHLAWLIQALGLLMACAPASGVRFNSSSHLPDTPRRPDGSSVNPTSSPPAVQDGCNADAGIVTLRTPLGSEGALVTVRAFFEAVRNEDPIALNALAAPTATVSQTRAGALLRVHHLGYSWQQRFQTRAYENIEPATLFRSSEVEFFDAKDAAALPVEFTVASAGEALGPTDVIARVHVLGEATASRRAFGDTLTFWLRQDGQHYLVYRIAEDIPL